MNEGGLWKWLRPRLPPGDYTRIESPVSPGVPDVNYQLQTLGLSKSPTHGWLELKIGLHPSPQPFNHPRRGLRPAQELWGRNRSSMGGLVTIAARIGPTFAMWRLEPHQFEQFNLWTLTTLQRHATLWTPMRGLERIDCDLLR